MQCMEVWGGNAATDNGVVMQGLDAWLCSRPYQGQERGGDIHYVSSCASGRITRLLVADVAGHGAAVADTATALRNLMRRFINFVDQSRLVRALNEEFATLADAGVFATAVVATYWAPTDYLVVCNAGHPRPLIYRARGRQKGWSALLDSEEARAEGLVNVPLGITDSDYSQFGVHLGRDDLVLFYSDSLVECRGPDGALIGAEGLARELTGLDASNPAGLVPSLLERLLAVNGAPLSDDVTALLIRPNSLKPRASVGAGIASAWRVTRAFLASLRPGGERFGRPETSMANLVGAFFERAGRRWGGPPGGRGS